MRLRYMLVACASCKKELRYSFAILIMHLSEGGYAPPMSISAGGVSVHDTTTEGALIQEQVSAINMSHSLATCSRIISPKTPQYQ